MQIENSSFYMQ